MHQDPIWLRKYKKEKHSNWKGGKALTTQGYVSIYKPEHPNCNSNGRVMEHRLVMEAFLGRYLNNNECVHHINGFKKDNRIENLELTTNSAHRAKHSIGNKFADGNSNWLGRKHKESSKIKIAKAIKGIKRSNDTKEKLRIKASINVKNLKRNNKGQFIKSK